PAGPGTGSQLPSRHQQLRQPVAGAGAPGRGPRAVPARPGRGPQLLHRAPQPGRGPAPQRRHRRLRKGDQARPAPAGQRAGGTVAGSAAAGPARGPARLRARGGRAPAGAAAGRRGRRPMVRRFRRRRTGPGPAGTALPLLALVLAVAYLYYETPLIQGGGAWPRLPGPPQPAWSADLPAAWAGEPGELLLSVGDRHILTARAAAGMVEAVWYDRFGYAAAQSPQLPVDGAPGGPLAASGLLVLAGEPDVPLLRVLSPASPPGGMTWRPPVPAAGIRPVAVHQALLAAAVFGAPQGPDLAPDLLAVLDIGGSEPALRWSQPYQERRLLQGAGGPAGLAVTTVDPESGSFRLELWSWQGGRLWSSDSSAGPLRLLAVGPSGHDAGVGSDPGSVPARAWVADGVALTSVGPGGAGRALTDGR